MAYQEADLGRVRTVPVATRRNKVEPSLLAAPPGNDRSFTAFLDSLPDVLALIARADAERDSGELQQAIATYREALAIDPRWTPAGEAIAALTGELRDAEFERQMSKGYSALAAENLQKMGYTNVKSMDGGWRGWTEAGLPTES